MPLESWNFLILRSLVLPAGCGTAMAVTHTSAEGKKKKNQIPKKSNYPNTKQKIKHAPPITLSTKPQGVNITKYGMLYRAIQITKQKDDSKACP
jgi:hypothetical protein